MSSRGKRHEGTMTSTDTEHDRPLRILGLVDLRCIHIPKWANYFAERGHHVQLVSFAPFSAARVETLHPSIRVETWTIPTVHLKRFWITLRTIRRLRQLATQSRPDVINAHFLGHAAWYAALSAVRPLVVTVMGGDIMGGQFLPTSRRERYLTPFTLRRADLAVCWSQSLLQVVSPMLRPGADADVVVGGVDRNRFSPGSAPELRESLDLNAKDFVVLSPRIFRPLYNIETIVRAFAVVVDRLPRARLLLVKHHASQHPAYTRMIEALLDRLDLRPAVRLLDEIPNALMPLYYRAANCTVSIPDTDGTPMTALESMACGTPVVIQDIPDYDPQIFIDKETVIRVPVRQPAALAGALLRLAHDADLRERLWRQGPSVTARHADYHSEMARLERLYRTLIHRRPASTH